MSTLVFVLAVVWASASRWARALSVEASALRAAGS